MKQLLTPEPIEVEEEEEILLVDSIVDIPQRQVLIDQLQHVDFWFPHCIQQPRYVSG